MSEPKQPNAPAINVRLAVLAATLLLVAAGTPARATSMPLQDVTRPAHQDAKADAPHELKPGQTLEREMAGAEAHRYGFSLQKDECFEVRVEQRGVDVTLKLLDSGGNVLATMDSPNGKQGRETLSFVAARAGSFVLEVSAPAARAEKGAYSLRREESRPATSKDRRRVEVERLFAEGVAALGVKGREREGFRMLAEAEAGWGELADEDLRKLTIQLVVISELREAQGTLSEGQQLLGRSRADAPAARAKLDEALRMFRALRTKLASKEMAEMARSPGEPSRPLLGYLDALRLLSMQGEALALDGTAQTHRNLGEYGRQVEYLKLALAAYEEAIKFVEASANPNIDKKRELVPLKSVRVAALTNLASTLTNNFGRYDEALKYLNPALDEARALYEETRDPRLKDEEALTLQQLGLAHLDETQDRRKGIEFLSQAADVYRALPGREADVATILSVIGSQHAADFDYAEALEYTDAALEIHRRLDNKAGQMMVLHSKASMYYLLDDKPKVRESISEALTILQSPDFAESFKRMGRQTKLGVFEELNADLAEFVRLDRIAYSYQLLEEYEKAAEYYGKALAAARAQNSHPGGVRSELRSIAFVYMKLERWDKAYEYATRALEISRGGVVREETATDLAYVGQALSESGRPREALKHLNEALALYRVAGVDGRRGFSPLYSPLLIHLARTHAALGNRRMAIFFGKQAVNAIQDERRRLSNFDGAAQKGFLGKKEKNYRHLADWLIAEGRIPEAEQVLGLLKQEEIFGYLRRDASESQDLQKSADLSPEEREALARYNSIADSLAALGAEYGELSDLGDGRTPAQQKRYEELSKTIEGANEGFQAFLKQLAAEFGRKRLLSKESLNETFSVQERLQSWGEGVVFLYTLVGEDRYRVILVTPDARTDGKTEIRADVLSGKIADFRRAVMNPGLDPRLLGKELYDILIGPVEKQLKGARAKTLLWSLDGDLRLLPLAALWDGQQYFGQRYQNVTITPTSRDNLSDPSSPDWRALALGVSEARRVEIREPNETRVLRFDPLPSVRAELLSIIRSEQSPKGVMPGQSLLDAEFSQGALEKHLAQGYKVVHIASHFKLNPGDVSKSFLLLGDGNILTVRTMRDNPRLKLTGVELLTLSACETAVLGKDSSGTELEGFGYVAQQNGARAILATLWPVADESTQLLMSEFYRLRMENPPLTKAAALQLAQREMIEGRLSPSSRGDVESGRGTKLAADGEVAPGRPRFTSDPSKPYAHPYFWSPFVLIGNWK
ncbi:MAG TPA: CHAT domain-containing protein [Pyrinomonadaceae bacterium]|jgi:CHAT domain-containing protein